MAIGCNTTVTQEPSSSRASQIGVEVSKVRLTRETIFLDDVLQLLFVLKFDIRLKQAVLAPDKYMVGTVDHDFRNVPGTNRLCFITASHFFVKIYT